MYQSKHLFTTIITIVIISVMLQSCWQDNPHTDEKENSNDTQQHNSDYIISEYFRDTVLIKPISKKEMIKIAQKIRNKYPDKDGGIIKFIEPNKELAWGYIEYHFPLNSARENDNDLEDKPIEIKIY